MMGGLRVADYFLKKYSLKYFGIVHMPTVRWRLYTKQLFSLPKISIL